MPAYLDVKAVCVSHGVDSDGSQTKLFASSDNTNSNLSSVCNEYFCKVGSLHSDAVAPCMIYFPARGSCQGVISQASKASGARTCFTAQRCSMTGRLWCWRCQPAAGDLSESKANLRVHITHFCSRNLDMRRIFGACSRAMQSTAWWFRHSAYLSRRVRALRNRLHHLQH